MKVVDSGYKIDLHIHSICSRGKDKGKVAFNTVENISVLAGKLNENGVQICAITDHDIFDYDMYSALKKYETLATSSIVKVFPGVEFSVEFQGDSGTKVVHVIAIFDDNDDEKIRKISSYLLNEKNEVVYDREQAFSEEKFLSLLRKFDLDTVLIAHQKSTLSTTRPYKNDAKSVGEARFSEFVYTDYFEAFEFKNKKNEVFNKSFLNANNMADAIRFITGSDCHDWRYYPGIDEHDNTDDFVYSYVKCLPNFRGLVMAITDHRRIKTNNSFFNPTATYIHSISMEADGRDYEIPLSRGINVIIGDNSIGKSLLLHKLTGYRKQQDGLLTKQVVAGYNKYLKKNKVEIFTELTASEVFAFDMQGEVRSKFEQEKIKSDDFLKVYYPVAINPEPYKEKLQRKLQQIYTYLEEKYAIEMLEEQLGRFPVLVDDAEQAESLSFVGTVARDNKRVEGYTEVVSELDLIIEKLETLMVCKWLEPEDGEQLDYIAEQLDGMSMRYEQKKKKAELENKKIALFQAAINNFKQKYNSTVSDSQKRVSTFNDQMNAASDAISNLIARRRKNTIPDLEFDREQIGVLTNRVYDYEFNSRLGITEMDSTYLQDVFSSEMRKIATKSVLEMTQAELAEALKGFTKAPSEALEDLKVRVNERIEEDFAPKFTITQAGTDRTQELSAGFNAKIYFDLLSYESSHAGMYIIDQPEDNISQKSIREYLLDRFKIMGENRQVLIVTHNPQFIVNLDVDNVIYLGREDDGLVVQSGALEYRDEEYNILDIISNHVEGGLETLKRRWKRYEKNTSV